MANGFPFKSVDKPFRDHTGLVRLSDSKIVFEDDFTSGPCGWGQLVTGGGVYGTVSLNDREARGVHVRVPAIANIGAMAIKRCHAEYGHGRHLLEALIYKDDINLDLTRPRYVEFGIDSSLEDAVGTRRYTTVRWHQYDETAVAQANKWQYRSGDGSTWIDMPGTATLPTNSWPTNENKRLPFYIAIDVDTNTGIFYGFRFSRFIQLGTLATTPVASGVFTGAANSGGNLATFSGGLNPLFSIQARSAAAQTASAAGILWCRLTRLSYTGF